MSTNLKIAVTGSFGCMDIGDEAMLTEDLDFIINDLDIPRENIFLFGSDAAYTASHHMHPLELCFSTSSIQRDFEASRVRFADLTFKQKIKKIIKLILNPQEIIVDEAHTKAAKSCDVLLVTGGGTINTRDAEGSSLKRIFSLVKYFQALDKPIFMSGQTIGPLGLYQEHDALAKNIIESVNFLTVRDQYYSKRYIDLLGAKPQEFIETFDDAYTLSYQESILPTEVGSFIEPQATFALNVTEYTSDSPQQRIFIAELCERIIADFNTNIVLVSHTPKDYYNLCIIYDMVNNDFKANILLPDTRKWGGRQLKKLISQCRVAIGGRYHFIVFAGTSNTPFVGMCGNHYSYIKQDGFARALGLEKFILTEKETWNMQVILKKIDDATTLNLELEDKFVQPSVSMRHFGEWINQYMH
jgi:polysaccharide pyruvyl transferase WcaK-like protein